MDSIDTVHHCHEFGLNVESMDPVEVTLIRAVLICMPRVVRIALKLHQISILPLASSITLLIVGVCVVVQLV
jgi:hypothetical protein